jgi:uncharacterized membrane protein
MQVLKSQRVWLWSIIVLGASLRLYQLDDQSLWLDEGLQYVVAANNSLTDILFTRLRSFHPPLSFVINHIALNIGESALFLRLPSALFGIATLPLFYVLARALTSGRTALISTVVLAFSPFHIWYSQDGRMYAQLLFFSVLSSVALLKALRSGTWHWWVAYIVIAVLGMYTQIFMVLALLAQFLWVLLCQRRYIIHHLVSGVAVLMLFLPWVVFLPWVQFFFRRVAAHSIGAGASMGSQEVFRAGFSPESIPYTLFAYAAGFSLGPTVAELHENRTVGFLMQFAPEIMAVGLVFGTLLVIGVCYLCKQYGTGSTMFCLLGLCLPIFGVLLYALAPKATYNVRYSIVAFPYFCIFLGTGAAWLLQKHRVFAVGFSFAVVGIVSISLSNHYFNPRYAKEDIRSAVAFWRAESQGDFLLSYRSHHVLSAYLTKPEKERHMRLGDEASSSIDRVFVKTETPSVYILLARDWGRLKEKAIRSAYRVSDERSYPGVKILKIVNSRNARRHAAEL